MQGGDKMATYIEHSSLPYERRDSLALGFIAGLIVLLAALFLVFYYGVPAISNNFGAGQNNVPGKIDVNINTPPQQGGPPVQNAPAPPK